MSNENPYGTDWSNIDLDSHQVEYSIIDEYTFDDLLLEINCNLPKINKESVMKQFEDALQSRITSAREVMRDNLDNILKHANKERNQD